MPPPIRVMKRGDRTSPGLPYRSVKHRDLPGRRGLPLREPGTRDGRALQPAQGHGRGRWRVTGLVDVGRGGPTEATVLHGRT